MRSWLLLLLVPLASGGLTTINIGSRSFYNYDRLDRPSKAAYPGRCKAGAEPTTVKVRMTLERFHSVNPKHGTFGLDGYLTAVWEDGRLAFDPTTAYDSHGHQLYTGDCTTSITTSYDFTQVTPDDDMLIWLPDIHFIGEESVEWRGSRATTIFANGTVEWSRALRLVLHCTYRLDPFPYDTHTCTVAVGDYAQSIEEVTLEWTDVPGQEPFHSDSWKVDDFFLTRSGQGQYNTSFHNSQAHSYITQTISLTRNPNPTNSAYLTNCFVAVLFSYAGFFISAAAVPARVALGLLCAIFVITNKFGLAHKMPDVTYDIFLIDFLIHSFLFCAAAFLEFALLNYGMQCAAWVKANPAPKEEEKYAPTSPSQVRPEDDAVLNKVIKFGEEEEANGGAPATAGAAPPKPTAMAFFMAMLPPAPLRAKMLRKWMTMCATFRHLDVICRFLYPIIYLSFTLHTFNSKLSDYKICAATSC